MVSIKSLFKKKQQTNTNKPEIVFPRNEQQIMVRLVQISLSLLSLSFTGLSKLPSLTEEPLLSVMSQLQFGKNISTSFLSGVEQRREGKNQIRVR